jgi:hypothetical protein
VRMTIEDKIENDVRIEKDAPQMCLRSR